MDVQAFIPVLSAFFGAVVGTSFTHHFQNKARRHAERNELFNRLRSEYHHRIEFMRFTCRIMLGEESEKGKYAEKISAIAVDRRSDPSSRSAYLDIRLYFPELQAEVDAIAEVESAVADAHRDALKIVRGEEPREKALELHERFRALLPRIQDLELDFIVGFSAYDAHLRRELVRGSRKREAPPHP